MSKPIRKILVASYQVERDEAVETTVSYEYGDRLKNEESEQPTVVTLRPGEYFNEGKRYNANELQSYIENLQEILDELNGRLNK